MSKVFNRLKQDVMAVFFAAVGVFIALSLYSFNSADPSLNSTGSHLKVANLCGYVGSFLSDGLLQLFGLSSWLFVMTAFRYSYLNLKGEFKILESLRTIWATGLVIVSCLILTTYWPEQKIYANEIFLGGLVGIGLSQILVKVFNPIGVQVVLWGAATVLVLFYSEKTIGELIRIPMNFFAKIKLPKIKMNWKLSSAAGRAEKPKAFKAEANNTFLLREEEKPALFKIFAKEKPEADKNDESESAAFTTTPEEGEQKTRKITIKTKIPSRVENWNLPKLQILDDPPETRLKVDEKEIRRKSELLKEKLAHFSVTGSVVAAKPGPAVTMFEFKPDADVKLSKITELEDDLSLALSSESLRIIAPIPGRDVVGIETSNANREVVYLKELLADESFWREDNKLPIALGKQASGEPKIVDLRKMPHLMVAGTTGSGKSVFIVSTISGLLFKHSPKTLRLILVDPKQVDLAAYEKIPHLLMPVVTDCKQAVSALRWVVREMEKRYKSMSKFGARGLEQYNENVDKLSQELVEEHEKKNQEFENTPGQKIEQYYFQQLPYIVVVIEEFGDLMSVDKVNVEQSVVRLAQKARACGIHLILAMQSPRKEVVTGLIKTNIPGRISFKVSSSMDSRIILDDVGAERLLAQGDMLFRNPGGSNLIRHHGPFLKDAEILDLSKFWSSQADPVFDENAVKAIENQNEFNLEGGDSGEAQEYDERYDEILSWASNLREISASLIQRRFQLGYPRAARIIEAFEREGVVGPANGSKPRQVLVQSLAHLEEP